jgi:hypothetical protein
MNKKNFIWFLFLSLAVLWTGCTEENFSDCPTGFWVTFIPENSKHDFAEEVQNLDLYFYDPAPNGALIEKIAYTRQQLRPADGAAYVSQDSIPAGEYRVVAIVNDDIHTRTNSSGTYYGIHSELADTEIDYKPVAFFSGETDLLVEEYLTLDDAQEFPVYLYKHNNQIRVNIIYDADYELPAGGRIETYIHGSNGRYHHSTRSCRSGETNDQGLRARFLPFERFERLDPEKGEVSEIYLSTMHIWHGSDLNLHFDEVGGTRAEDPTRSFDLNLTDLLKKVSGVVDEKGETISNPYNTDDKLRFHDDYEIWIKFGKTSISTQIGIDNWATVSSEVEL